jgi:putative hydrolase of HD superfamily
MTAKNQNPVSHLGGKNAHPLIELFFEINHLKQVFRKGWLRKIPPENCESVAEHTFGTALLAWILADKFFPRLDQEKVLKLALIHDLGEIYAGDITPYDEVAPEEKNKRESEAVRKIFSSLPNGDQYITLWEEYENGSSPEATFVKQIDRLANLEEFFNSAAQAITSPKLESILQEILRNRREVVTFHPLNTPNKRKE